MTGWNIFLEEMKEKRGGGKKGEKRASNHTFLGGGVREEFAEEFKLCRRRKHW